MSTSGVARELPGVTTPTLVMHGDKDTLIDQTGGRRAADSYPEHVSS